MIKQKIGWFDHYVFDWLARELKDKSIDEICGFYVDKLCFKNPDYLKRIMAQYKLPNDFLKLHKKIELLSTQEYEKAIGEN